MHNVNYTSYPLKVNKSKVQSTWDAYAERDGDGYGLPGNIVWKENKHFKDYDSAVKWIEENDNGGYWQVAVLYDVAEKPLKSAKLAKLQEKHKEAYQSYREAESKLYYTPATVKGKLLACKKCESKLAVSYLRSNYCPVCGNDLRSPTVKKQLASKKEKIDMITEQINREEAALFAKAKKETKWLVKTEYHS